MQNQLQHITFNERYIKNLYLSNIQKIRFKARHVLAPVPDVLVSDWAEQNIILPEDAFADGKPRRFKSSRVPHCRGILNAVNNPKCRKITIMGSSQIAKTTIVLIILFYYIFVKPCNIAYMLPTLSDAIDFARDKFDKLVNANPQFKKLIRNNKKENSAERESSKVKRYPGGRTRIFPGGSSSGTRGRTEKLTVGDDIDQLVIGQQREGDPVFRLSKRSTVYKKTSLNINVSTPTIAEESRISALYDKSNMSKFHVTCPHCQALIYFKPERLAWQKDYDQTLFDEKIPDEKRKIIKHHPNTAVYACDNCSGVITEADRRELLEHGQWIAERPEIDDHYGFWINELSSTLSSFENVAKQIIDAGDDPEKLEALYNTVFGLPYVKNKGEKADPDTLIERMKREGKYISKENPFEVPNEILFAVMATDVQADRLECLVLGVGMDMELYVLLYQRLYGDTLNRQCPDTWMMADKIYFANWHRKDGVKIPLLRHFVDSGYRAQSVYSYTRRRDKSGVWAIKGKGGPGVSMLPRSYTWQDYNRTKLLLLGSNAAKHELFGLLKNELPGARYIHFAEDYCDEEFFKQLTTELAVTKYSGLVSYIVYEKPRRTDHNEATDLMYYCICAIYHVNANYTAVKNNMDRQAENIAKNKLLQIEQPVTTEQIKKPVTNNFAVSKRRTTARRTN